MSFFKTNIKSKEIKSLPDEQLVRQILLTQDRIMQEELYDRYIQKVYHKCLTLVKNKEAAEDITHDVMVKVFSRLSSYQEKSPFYGWIFAITYNQCMDSLNLRKKLHLETYEEYKGDVPDTDDIEQENKVLKELRLGQLEVFFKELADSEKLILLMRYQDGLSVKEIAEVLHVGESAVKMRLKRSRDRLAELIKSAAHDE